MPSSSYKHINSVSLEAAAIMEFRSIVTEIKFFDSCVYLGLKSGKWQQDQIVPNIFSRPGYEKFKIIKYAILWTHLYIKFKNPVFARAAVAYFTNLDQNLTCEIVSTLLAQWYYFERLDEDKKRTFTYTLVDIQGSPPGFIDFLAPDVVGTALKRFGRPQTVYSDKYKTKVQVVFPTMAEALAACIALGLWYESKPHLFYYRVRIEAAEKEAALIKDCLKNCEDLVEAFKLDYFVLKDDSAWSHLKTICQELFVQDETAKIFENRDSFDLQAPDGLGDFTITNSAMGIEIPDQPEFLPYARTQITGQTEFKKSPRRFYENPGQSSVAQKKWCGETRRFSLPSLDNRRTFTPQGSNRQQTHIQTWMNKEFRKNSGKKFPQTKFSGKSENYET